MSGNRLGFRRIIASEWIKLATLKSTWFLMICYLAINLLIAIGASIVTYIAAEGRQLPAEDAATSTLELCGFMATSLGTIVFMAFAALAVTNEYRSGQMRVTFTAAPRRLLVVLGKAVVTVLMSVAAVLASYLLSALAGWGIFAALGTGFAPPASTYMEVLGAMLFAGAVAAISAAVGWLTRSTAGAVMTGVLALTLFPMVVQQLIGLPEPVGQIMSYVWLYWPTTLGGWLASGDEALTPGGSGVAMGLMWVWAVVATAVAAWVVDKRDA
jgi:ABC-2 type transport system permease protein